MRDATLPHPRRPLHVIQQVGTGGRRSAGLQPSVDTVPHERLLGKLAHYGIKGPIQQWIRAFLTDRTMWVTVERASSPATRVLSGVPQGTVMGPLLFLIYRNDLLSNVSPGTTVRLFADDCLVYPDITSEEDQLTLQKDLAALQDWAWDSTRRNATY